MTEEQLRKRCFEQQREIDRLTGAKQALEDVNGKLQIQRALQELRRQEETVDLLRQQMRSMETRHAKIVQELKLEIARIESRVDSAASYVKEKLNGEKTNGT